MCSRLQRLRADDLGPLLVEPEQPVAIAGTGGHADWSIAVPTGAALAGLGFYVQALVADAQANAFGAVATNAGEGVIR